MAHPQPFSDTLTREMSPYSEGLDVRVTDSSLRDGSHAKRHQFTLEHVTDIVAALDDAGVPVIEVTHGDGLGGSSFNYGFSHTPELDLIRAAVKTAKSAKIAFLMLPGLGTKDDIRAAQDAGGSICRIATHCTEADVSVQHFGLARELGLETVGFLMMSHSTSPENLARQARIMADAGCQCVYVVDSAGALIMEQTSDRVAALVTELGDEAQVGFHGHENLGLGVANSVLAYRAGARQMDGSTRRFGAGAGNTPVEGFVAVADKLGIRTGVDVRKIIDAAEDVVRPAMDGECLLDRLSLTMGYAGVYSSFLKHADRLAARYDVSGAELLIRAGERRLVGGQEDQLIDIALEIVAERLMTTVELTAESTRRVVEVNDFPLAFHDVGSGPPVVFLHGSGPGVTGWANFGANLAALSPTLRCLVVDQPGFGASGRPERYEKNYLRYSAEAVLGLLDALDLEQVALVGNSMGADVAVRLTLDHPERVSRLLLNGPGGTGATILGPSPSEGITRLMEFNADPTREKMVAWLRTMLSDQRRLTDELVASRMEAATQPGAVKNLQDAYATFYDPAMAELVPLFGEVHRIRQPVLMLWGRDDRVAPVEGALFPARRMARCDLRIFSRCGHWVQVERKDDFERAAVEFLAR